MNENNPLRQYFRQPAIYITLPSKGQFYPDGALSMPPTGEIPVFPMTAIDEITYRTPDALFNGQATVSVIQSCCPNIKDAWAVPSTDIDALLVAIRIASYGHEMEFSTTCPKCNHESDQGIDLRLVLDRLHLPDYNKTIKFGDMELFFRPMTYKNLNDNNKMQFENQKLLQMLPDSEIDDLAKMSALGAALKKVTDITVKALCQSIAAVKTPSALVTELPYIEELMQNCDRKLFNEVRDYIIETKTESEMKPLHLQCPECSHEYEQAVTLDMASFFEPAS